MDVPGDLRPGMQVGEYEAGYRFEQVVRRAPGHVLAHEERLQQVSTKWSGSNSRMFAFAREATSRSRAGSLLPVLLAQAHLEMMLELPVEHRATYMSDPLVLAELHAAAAHSIFHPACVRGTGWARRAGVFALAFFLAGDRPSAASLFDALGDQVNPRIWSYYDGTDPARGYAKARKLTVSRR